MWCSGDSDPGCVVPEYEVSLKELVTFGGRLRKGNYRFRREMLDVHLGRKKYIFSVFVLGICGVSLLPY